jgi:hypothetical protein
MRRTTGSVARSLIVATLFATAFQAWSNAAGTDEVVEAKRKSAIQLIRDGKYDSAVVILKEIVASSSVTYADHLSLAKAYEKLARSDEAIEQYRRVVEVVPNDEKDFKAKQARIEAEKRLKAVEGDNTRLNAAVDEFEKQLDTMEADAKRTKNASLMDGVMKYRAGMWLANPRPGRCGVPVYSAVGWQETDFAVTAGQKYRIRATGRWVIGASAACGPDGVPGKTNSAGRLGALLGHIGDGPSFVIGENLEFVAPATGRLNLMCNENTVTERFQSHGLVMVLIEAR